MLEDFNFKILTDPDFKEDSVREEIISPLLKKLGYRESGNNRIIRSKNLIHPFVYIGTKKRNVYIIPDYLLKVDGKNVLILDAKSPKQNILKGKNPEQAFCYSIHPDIRVKFYALCNGRELTVFDVSKIEPVLHIKMKEVNKHWNKINNTIGPIGLTKPQVLSYFPDFGLYLLKSGWKKNSDFHFIGAWVNMVVKIEDNLFSFFSSLKYDENKYAVSFDFSKDRYQEFLNSVPLRQVDEISKNLSRQPFRMNFDKSNTFEIIIHAKFGEHLITDKDEIYLPFEVIKFEPMHY
ncbi:MAG: type I restriction enzyme HsdR N-terminal domain-containing protein [Candidatus Cloacimonetes bacterium]|nr:type I restriction enzyme HsdR N-terminal domain-containing protein [Candidatus Cloacimonadota bacterium]